MSWGASDGVKKLAEKLEDYNARLDQGMAEEIKPDHVRKVLEKLQKKVSQLESDIGSQENSGKKARLTGKLGIARAQVERAEWLLKKINPVASD